MSPMGAILFVLFLVVSAIFAAGFTVGYLVGRRRRRVPEMAVVNPAAPGDQPPAVSAGAPVPPPMGPAPMRPAPIVHEPVAAPPPAAEPVVAPGAISVAAAPAPQLDPAEEARRREIRNVTIGLYSAALLVIAAGGLLLLSALPGAAKTLILAGMTAAFYLSGLTVLSSRPFLRPAAVGFVGIALALVPLTGLGMAAWLFPDQGALAAMITSGVGLVLYTHAAVTLSSRVLGYLSVVSVFSFAVSFGVLLQRGLLLTLGLVVVISTAVKLASLRESIHLPEPLRRAFVDLGPWYTPLTTLATLVSALVRSVSAHEFAVVLTLLGIHAAVAYRAGRRLDDLVALRLAALAVPLSWMHALGWQGDAFSAGLALIAAIHAVGFTRPSALETAAPWLQSRPIPLSRPALLWGAGAVACALPAMVRPGAWGLAAAVVAASAVLWVSHAERRRRWAAVPEVAVLGLPLPGLVLMAQAQADGSVLSSWGPFSVLGTGMALVAGLHWSQTRRQEALDLVAGAVAWPVILFCAAERHPFAAYTVTALLVLLLSWADRDQMPWLRSRGEDARPRPAARTWVMAAMALLTCSTQWPASLGEGHPARWILVAALLAGLLLMPSRPIPEEAALAGAAVAVALDAPAGQIGASLAAAALGVGAVLGWRARSEGDWVRSAVSSGCLGLAGVAGLAAWGGEGAWAAAPVVGAGAFHAGEGVSAIVWNRSARSWRAAGPALIAAGVFSLAVLETMGGGAGQSRASQPGAITLWAAAAALAGGLAATSIAVSRGIGAARVSLPLQAGLLVWGLDLAALGAGRSGEARQVLLALGMGCAIAGSSLLVARDPSDRHGGLIPPQLTWATAGLLIAGGLTRGAVSEQSGPLDVICLVLLGAAVIWTALVLPVRRVLSSLGTQVTAAGLVCGLLFSLAVWRMAWGAGLTVLLVGVAWAARAIREHTAVRWAPVVVLSSWAGWAALVADIAPAGWGPAQSTTAVLLLAGGAACGALRWARLPLPVVLGCAGGHLILAAAAAWWGGLLLALGGLALTAVGAELLLRVMPQVRPGHEWLEEGRIGLWTLLGGAGLGRLFYAGAGDWQPVLVLVAVGAALGLAAALGRDLLSDPAAELYAYAAAASFTLAALAGMGRSTGERSIALAGLAAVVILGLLRRQPVLTVWGSLCLCVSFLIFLENYTVGLLAVLAVAVAGLALWRLRSLK